MKQSVPTSGCGPLLPKNHVLVGKVISAWGIKGHFKIYPLTDVPERFNTGNVIYLNGRSSRIQQSRKFKKILVLKVDIIGDRISAESARGQILTVPETFLQKAPPGSYYHFHIIGMMVVDEQGECLGRVVRILPTGNRDVFVVSNDANDEILIPASDNYIFRVDVEANRMIVRIPNWQD